MSKSKLLEIEQNIVVDEVRAKRAKKSVFNSDLPTDKKSLKKTFELNTLLKPLLYFVFAVFLEFINFICLSIYHASSIDFGIFPQYFLLDVGVILILTGIIYLVQNKIAQNVFFYLFLSFQIIINVVNGSLFNKQGIFLNLDLFNMVGEAVQAFSWQFVDFVSLSLNIVMLIVIIVVQITFDSFVSKKFVSKRVRRLPLFLALFVAYSGLGFASYYTQRSLFSDDITFLYESKYSYPSMMNNFGTYGLIVNELASTIFPEDTSAYTDEILANAKNGVTEANPDAPLYGDNLIVLMLESFDSFVIDPYNTPTLYSLMQDGIYMSNFLSNNKTNISEILALMGYQPNSLTLSLKSDSGLASKYSLPNLFDDMGYTTNYFHSYLTYYYNRGTVNKNIGFDNVYGLEHANFENKNTTFGNWNREEDFLNAMIDKIAPTDEPFFSFYLTVATHGAYGNHLSGFDDCFETYDNNLNNLKNYWAEETSYIFPESDTLAQQYLRELKARAIDTDNIISSLIDHLKETGLMENTTLVIYADHNSYFNNLAYIIRGTSVSDYSNTYSYTVPLIIYSEKLDSQKIDDFCTTADIYTTICDLYGLPYNTFMCQGRSIFDETASTFVWSYLSGYYTEKFYSSDGMNVIKLDSNATDEELAEFKSKLKEFIQKELLLDKAIKYDIKV